MELPATVGRGADADGAGQVPGSPGLHSVADLNWIQEYMDWDWRQENMQSPSGMLSMKEEMKFLMVPQL